jgi:hypothetical protein
VVVGLCATESARYHAVSVPTGPLAAFAEAAFMAPLLAWWPAARCDGPGRDRAPSDAPCASIRESRPCLAARGTGMQLPCPSSEITSPFLTVAIRASLASPSM